MTNIKNKDDFWSEWIKYEDTLTKQCLKYLKYKKHDAEDAMSTAAIKAYNNYDKATIRDIKPWLCRIIYNTCMDFYRQNSKVVTNNFSSESKENNIYDLQIITSEKNSVEKKVQSDRLSKHLQIKINNLNLIEREILHRRVNENCSHESIAKIMDISATSSRKYYQLAKKTLRDTLDHTAF